MLHLSPESGKWLPCLAGDDGKCELKYHAPGEEGEVAESLLWEMYASEELYREPSNISNTRRMWRNAKGELHRGYGLPAVEYANGTKAWYLNGKQHRVDGPAFEGASGHKEWWINGEPHRTDGPAFEYADGTKEWWVNGVRVEPGSATANQ